MINRGESLAITGSSGSGKSTLLTLLAGLDTPSEGEIWLDGSPLHALDADARADLRYRTSSFIFQSFLLLEHFTALENVMLPLEMKGDSAAGQQAATLLTQMGLHERLHHYPRQLSGGEQQRVALARAFACRAPVIFADEPTGNLDQRTGNAVMDLLFAHQQQSGTTLILVTHDLSLANRCQRMLRIHEGKVVAVT
ncbi:MAG: hypothetical protein RIQ52_479 [Pseudomonadota bacterium]